MEYILGIVFLMTTFSFQFHKTETIMQAKWNGVTIAESRNTVEVEGNHYFPYSSVNKEYLKKTDKTSTCPWKGTASYFDVIVDGKTNSNAAWTYPSPKPAASNIKDHVAFWKGVQVS